SKLTEIYQIAGKQDRDNAASAYKDEIVAELSGEGAEFADRAGEISKAFGAVTKQVVRQRILTDQVRMDGRGLADIRQLSAEVEV
ncbi:polyribonucleotide nucleotidyltransferase, partial [Escherichia coli]|nr:polyribonucleotide nucleotidyltransferase [Escherichia coli]